MTEIQAKLHNLIHSRFTETDLADQLIDCNLAEIPANEQLLREGDYVKVVPLVLEGSVKVIRMDDSGREILLYHISVGESCALSISAVLNFDKSKALAITEEPTLALIVPADKVREWMYTYRSWNKFVLGLYQQRFGELIDLFDELAFKNMDIRLISKLKEKLENRRSGMVTLTHQQLANELGTAREVVSRLLKQLEKQGYLINHRGKIEIIHLM
jgi:CRP/FNR family transcriptional regulator